MGEESQELCCHLMEAILCLLVPPPTQGKAFQASLPLLLLPHALHFPLISLNQDQARVRVLLVLSP